MKKGGIIVVLIVLLLASVAGCGGGGNSDEAQVESLIKQGSSAFNEGNWHALYTMMSPNYRQTVSFEEFEDFAESMESYWLVMGGGKLHVTSISVQIEREWAYASYKVMLDDEFLGWATDDIFRKVGGKWYDVTEDPTDPGYNYEDLPH